MLHCVCGEWNIWYNIKNSQNIMTSHRSKKVACFPGSSTFNSSFLGYIFVKNDRNFAILFTAYRSSINLYTPLYLQSLVVPNEINLDILRLNKNKEIRLPRTNWKNHYRNTNILFKGSVAIGKRVSFYMVWENVESVLKCQWLLTKFCL